MNENTEFELPELIRSLEWDRFIDLAHAEARTEPAKIQIAHLVDPANWAVHIAHAQTLQMETQEMTPLLDREALWGPLLELPDPSSLLVRLS